MCFVWSGVLVKWFMRLQENKLIIISISYSMLRTQKERIETKWNENKIVGDEIHWGAREATKHTYTHTNQTGSECYIYLKNIFRLYVRLCDIPKSMRLFLKFSFYVYVCLPLLVIYQEKQWIKMGFGSFISRFKQDI